MKLLRNEAARYELAHHYGVIAFGQQQIRSGRQGIGGVLRRLREARGWTFREAADIIGCDTSSLSKLEKGQKWNEQTAKKAIATYLG